MKSLSATVKNKIAGTLSKRKIFFASSLTFLHRDRKIDTTYLDYIRQSALELVCHEIKSNNVPGNLAELGVYKGQFAKYINQYLSDRKFYLFDTFEGFAETDVSYEVDKKFSAGNQNFADTSVRFVLGQMPFPDQCVIKKGLFPGTAEGLEDQFALVSLDSDLYKPIYSGLEYFYPRLSPGGYIFVHDYNNDGYKGVREAVKEYCIANGIAYTPLPDSGGTAIIGKPLK